MHSILIIRYKQKPYYIDGETLSEFLKSSNASYYLNDGTEIKGDALKSLLKTKYRVLKLDDEELSGIDMGELSDKQKVFIQKTFEEHNDTLDTEFEGMKKEPNELQMLKGLKWRGNSCYQDSVLFALFFDDNSFIKEQFFENRLLSEPMCNKNSMEENIRIKESIRLELKRISNYITGKSSDREYLCGKLRSLIKQCDYTYVENFYDDRIKDPVDFLTYLFNLFDVKTLIVKKELFVPDKKNNNRSWELISTELDPEIPIIPVVQSLSEMKEITLSSFLIEKEKTVIKSKEEPIIINGERYGGKFNRTTYIPREYAIFNVPRLAQGGNIASKLVIKEDKIKDLSLKAIILYHALHYTCYFNFRNQWYLYDDNKKEMITHLPGFNQDNVAFRRGTLYFYSK